MAYIFGTKHDNTSGQVRWQLEGVCYIVSRTFSDKRLKTGLQVLHSTSFPGFADGDQQTELIHTLPNGRQQIALTTCDNIFGVDPSRN